MPASPSDQIGYLVRCTIIGGSNVHRLRHLLTAAALVVLRGGYRKGLRHALLASFSLLVFAASAGAETAQPPLPTPPLPAAPPAKSTKLG
jgi:hypothetical protein